MTRNPKLRGLLSISRQPRELEIHSWAKDVSQAFVLAESNIGTLAYIIPSIIHATILQERIFIEAVYKATGGIDPPRPDAPDLQRVVDFANNYVEERTLGDFDHQSVMRDAIDRWESSTLAPNLSSGWQVYMSSILSNAWTAFEILAGDLWTAALNHHPHVLSELSGQKNRISDLAGQKLQKQYEIPNSAAGNKSIPLQLVQMHSYNLENSMGSILRQSQSFDRLEGIRSAYSLAFSRDSLGIDQVLASKTIDSVNLLRNLIVHQAGRIDRIYLNKTKKLPDCPRGDPGQTIFLDGEIVANLTIAIITSGYELIRGVDRWIFDHPNKIKSE